MAKHSPEVREEIDRCIRDASNAGFTAKGTIEFIKDKTGVLICPAHLSLRRTQLRKLNEKAWERYRSENFAYKLEYINSYRRLERASNITYDNMLKYEQELKDGKHKHPYYLHRSIQLLREVERDKLEILDRYPMIDTVGHTQHNEMEQGISELESAANGEVQPQRSRVF